MSTLSYLGSAGRIACSAAAHSPASCLLPSSFREAHAVARWFGCRELRLAPFRHCSGEIQASSSRPTTSALLFEYLGVLACCWTGALWLLYRVWRMYVKLLEGASVPRVAGKERPRSPAIFSYSSAHPSIDATNDSRRSESPKGSQHRITFASTLPPPICTSTSF
jgi:hypothetical protein